MLRKPAELPSLKYDFGHSFVEAVEVGADREMTLTVAVLEAHGHRGQHAYTVQVTFSGLQNLDEVLSFFAAPAQARELAGIGYSREKASRPGHLVIEMVCENGEERLEVRCGSVQVSGPRG